MVRFILLPARRAARHGGGRIGYSDISTTMIYEKWRRHHDTHLSVSRRRHYLPVLRLPVITSLKTI